MAPEYDTEDETSTVAGRTAEATVPALFLGVFLLTVGLILALVGYAIFSDNDTPDPDVDSTASTSEIDILIAESKGIRDQLPRTKGVAESNSLLNRRLEIVNQLANRELSQQQENFCWISKLESISMLNLLNIDANAKDSQERLRQLGSIAQDAFDLGDPQVKKTALIANELRLAQTIVFCPNFDSESAFNMLQQNTSSMLESFPRDPDAVRSVIESTKILRDHDFEELATQLTSDHLSEARSDPQLRNLFADEVRTALLGQDDLADFSRRVSFGNPESLKRLERVFAQAETMKDVPESVLSSIAWLTESLLSNPDTVELATEYAHRMKTSEPFKSSMGVTLTRLVEGLEKRAARIGTAVTLVGKNPRGVAYREPAADDKKPALLLFILNDTNTKRSVDFLLGEVDDMIANSNLDKRKFDIFIFGDDTNGLMEELQQRIGGANVLLMQSGGPAEQLKLGVFPYAVWIDENRIVKRMNIHTARIANVAFEEITSAKKPEAAR